MLSKHQTTKSIFFLQSDEEKAKESLQTGPIMVGLDDKYFNRRGRVDWPEHDVGAIAAPQSSKQCECEQPHVSLSLV